MPVCLVYTQLCIKVSRLYGLFVIIGGLMGYFQAGSTTSLFSGLIAGIISIGASFFAKNRHLTDISLKVLLAVSLVLAAVFQRRFAATGQFMPAGFMVINSGGLIMLSAMARKEGGVETIE